MGNCCKSPTKSINLGLDISVLIITSYAQRYLAQAFKYSLDGSYPINSTKEEDVYSPVRVYKNIRLDQKQSLNMSINISRCVSVFNTEPYNDYYLDHNIYGFNIIIIVYDSKNISAEDFTMLKNHLNYHIHTYNPEKIIGMDFNTTGETNDNQLPTSVNMVITKIPRSNNFADRLLDRVFNSDIIQTEKSITSDIPSQSY